MKPAIAIVCFLVACCPLTCVPAQNATDDDKPPKDLASPVSKTYWIRPQGELRIKTKYYSVFDIEADYPIDVLIGSCSAVKVLHYHCETKTARIFIYDRRKDPNDDVSNVVKITAYLSDPS